MCLDSIHILRLKRKGIMSLSRENIKNAFSVVYSTLENVKKLIEYCDMIAESNGYTSSSSKFLRDNTDKSVDGWVYTSLFKVYQRTEDTLLDNNLRNGPLYVLEINLEEYPMYYLSKFEYEDISSWKKGISPSDWWLFYYPTSSGDERIKFNELDNNYIESIPKESYKSSYRGLNRTVFTSGDLLEVNKDSVESLIFGGFNELQLR